ncbi:MAG: flavin reductase family protein, partial [Lachnospiraceae bacterium]
MLYPLPVVMVSAADKENKANIITVGWTGTVCSDPVMLYVSIRPERYTYHMIKETGEFVINLTTEALAYATDYCGVKSGQDIDKW